MQTLLGIVCLTSSSNVLLSQCEMDLYIEIVHKLSIYVTDWGFMDVYSTVWMMGYD